jgi:hypothetical protein
MPRRSFLPPCETSTGRRRADQGRAARHALDRHHARVAAGTHEGVGLLRGKAGVQRETRQRHRRARGVRPVLGQQLGQSLPHRVAGGVAHQHAVLDQPGLLAAPEGPDRDLDAILLHVGATHQQQAARRHAADAVVLAALDQRCQSGASPSSTQVSPSSVFLKVLMAAADPDSLLTALSHAAAMSRQRASPPGCTATTGESPPSCPCRRIARHSPCSSIQVLWCSAIAVSQDSQM